MTAVEMTTLETLKTAIESFGDKLAEESQARTEAASCKSHVDSCRSNLRTTRSQIEKARSPGPDKDTQSLPRLSHQEERQDAALKEAVEADRVAQKELTAATAAKDQARQEVEDGWTVALASLGSIGRTDAWSKLSDLLLLDSNETPDKPIAQFGLNRPELQVRINALLTLLSTARIAEEMDTATYMSHLSDELDRIEHNARLAAHSLSENAEAWRKDEEHRRGHLETELGNLAAEINAALKRDASAEIDKAAATGRMVVRASIDNIRAAVDRSQELAKNIKTRAVRAHTVQTAVNITEEINNTTPIWQRPEGYAFAAMALVWGILMLPFSFAHTQYLTQVTIAVFVVVYFLSRYWIRKARNTRLNTVRDRFRAYFIRQLSMQQLGESQLDFQTASSEQWQDKAELVIPQPKTSGPALWRPRLAMVGVPLAVLAVIWGMNLHRTGDAWAQYPRDVSLVGKSANGTDCWIADGIYVGTDGREHFLLPTVNRPFGAYLVPRAYASRFATDTVIAISQSDASEKLSPCAQQATPVAEHRVNVIVPDINAGDTHVTVAMPEIAVTTPQVNMTPPVTGCTNAAICDQLVELATKLDGTVQQTDILIDKAQTLVAEASVTEAQFITVVTEPSPPTKPAPHFYHTLVLPGDVRIDYEDKLLVFFPTPPRGTNNDKETVYDLGRKSLTTAADTIDEARLSYFVGELARKVAEIAGQEEIVLTVRGFASVEWLGDVSDEDKDVLNHHLAEARRAAVLDYLRGELDKQGLSDRVHVPDRVGCALLSTYNSSFEPHRFFENYESLRVARAELAKDLPDDATKHLLAFINRSVTVEISQMSEDCAA